MGSHWLNLIVWTLVTVGVSCAIGAWIGSTKHRTVMGAILGVFGFIGWLIIALVPARSN